MTDEEHKQAIQDAIDKLVKAADWARYDGLKVEISPYEGPFTASIMGPTNCYGIKFKLYRVTKI